MQRLYYLEKFVILFSQPINLFLFLMLETLQLNKLKDMEDWGNIWINYQIHHNNNHNHKLHLIPLHYNKQNYKAL